MARQRDTSSESSRREVLNADLVGTDTKLFQLLWRYRAWKIGPAGVCYIVIYTVFYGKREQDKNRTRRAKIMSGMGKEETQDEAVVVRGRDLDNGVDLL